MFDGEPLIDLTPNEVAARGIARTFQNIRLVPEPVGARERDDRPPRAHARRVSGARSSRDGATRAEERAIHERAYDLLEYVGVASDANGLAKHLATATSAASRSRARSRPSRRLSRSTSPRPA